MMRLHVFPPSPRAIKVVAVKNHLDLECEICVVDYFRAEQTTPEFAKLNPNQRQPVLEDGEWTLWESNAILFYLAAKKPDAGLYPDRARDQADVMRWLFWEGTQWDPACDVLITERVKKALLRVRESGRRTGGQSETPQPPDPQRVAEGEKWVGELAGILDAHLADRPWLVGDKPSIADFALGAWMPSAARVGLPLAGRQAIDSWYGRVTALRGWRESLPGST
jgi:glutathione S-transferase